MIKVIQICLKDYFKELFAKKRMKISFKIIKNVWISNLFQFFALNGKQGNTSNFKVHLG